MSVAPDQIRQDRFTFGGLKIDGDGFLATIAGIKRGGEAIEGHPQVAHLLATRRLHLDHLRTLISQNHRRHRTGYHCGQVEHFYAFQWAHVLIPVLEIFRNCTLISVPSVDSLTVVGQTRW